MDSGWLGFAGVRSRIAAGASPIDSVMESYRRAAAAANQGIFTALVPEDRIARRIEELNGQAAHGSGLPLLGLTFSVKDNIHVAGMVTTCNCPGLAIWPERSATVVEKLEAAGAVLIGKNTLDQFATGLNGTRSPEPLCRNAINPDYIPGGSSSGSAVAVARDIVSFSLGSDTGGSGRVPAACNGIVGLKPTLGLVSTAGLVYNSRYFDVIPVFARSCSEAYEVLATIKGFDPSDDYCRLDADTISLAAPLLAAPRIAMPAAADLDFFGDDRARNAFASDIALLRKQGAQILEIDFSVFRNAGRHVFQSPMLAERLVTYREVIENRPNSVHPAVRAAIEPGARYTASEAFAALYEVQSLRRQAARLLAPFDALVVPTIPTIFTIEEMLADPMAKNSIMGTYTYFANPLDFCAVSVPGVGRSDGLPSALCLVSVAGADANLRTIATQFEISVLKAHSLNQSLL